MDLEKYVENKIQDLDNKLEHYVHILKNNSSSGDSSNDVVSDTDLSQIQNDIADLKTITSTNQTDISSLKDDNETNKTNITALQNSVNEISENITTLTNNVSVNSSNIETNSQNVNMLSESVSTNTQNIEVLQQNVNTNTESINTLNENVSQLETTADSVNQLASKVNTIENVTNKFLTLIKDRNAIANTPFEEIDQSIVVQTYDCADRVYNLTGKGDFHSGEFYFSVPTDCTARIKVIIHLNSESSGQGNLNLYLNGDTITETINYTFDTSTTFIEAYIDKPVLATGNMVYFKLNASQDITFTYAKFEISNCTNPVMLIQPKKFDVLYSQGKYYVSDCTTGKLKLATINVEDISNIADLQWVETDIEARECAFTVQGSGSVAPLTPVGVHYAVIDKQNKITFYDTIKNISKKITQLEATKLNYYFYSVNVICYCATITYSTTSHRKLRYRSENSEAYYMDTIYTDQSVAYFLDMKRLTDQLVYNSSTFMRCEQKSNGDIYLKNQYNNITLCKGRLLEFYSYNLQPYTYIVIVKVYDKIVKFVVNEDSSYNLTIESQQIIGTYDYYFEGIDNDYFVVKDNKLYYYKENLQEL